MTEEDREDSLPRESHRIVIPNEIVTPRSSIKKERRERICKRCCACTCVTIVIIGLILMILCLTVFKVKKPKLKLKSVTIEGLKGLNPFNPSPTTNLTLMADVSVKNPNIASLKIKNGTTEIYYKNVQVADSQLPPGNVKAKKTTDLNVTVDFILQNLLNVSGLVADLMAGSMPLDTKTRIKGKVDVIGIIKKTIEVKLDCNFKFVIANQTIQNQKCDTTVSL
ncbi:Immunoglobulin-like fold containing protein [Heracleum sosnowskyi]|uniref:Immunoglobulin-like fold containing protein n=1 Tax=Heracleum sosnowskyi TaxID=360622 RepID=A0AAD8M1T4_9APIA|nr:Immunoglobulin-like fold containing protein [Heracleum sosnowskyi]